MTGPTAPAMLEPDRAELAIFIETLFRHADKRGFVSLRGFYENGGKKPFRITPTSLVGGLGFLTDAALDDARRAAQTPKPVVFAPPIAVFTNEERATEKDLLEGLTLVGRMRRAPATGARHPREAARSGNRGRQKRRRVD